MTHAIVTQAILTQAILAQATDIYTYTFCSPPTPQVVPSGLTLVASGWKPLAGEFMTSIWQVYGLIVQSMALL